MKQLFLILLLLGTTQMMAQKKPATDSLPALTDTTRFLSVQDLFRLSDPLRDKLTSRQFETYINALNTVLREAWRQEEAARKQKGGK